MNLSIRECMREAHKTAMFHGWWEAPERTFGDQIALMHSELSEALEEFRTHDLEQECLLYTDLRAENGREFRCEYVEGRKAEGIAREFADVLIRIFDTSERYGIPLAKALEAKLAYNKTRPHKHGGKAI